MGVYRILEVARHAHVVCVVPILSIKLHARGLERSLISKFIQKILTEEYGDLFFPLDLGQELCSLEALDYSVIGVLFGEQPVPELVSHSHLAVVLDVIEAEVAEEKHGDVGQRVETLQSIVVREDDDGDACGMVNKTHKEVFLILIAN